MNGFVGSEFLGATINVRHAAKKPAGQQQMMPRGKGRKTAMAFTLCCLVRSSSAKSFV